MYADPEPYPQHCTALIDIGFVLCAVAEGALDEVVLPVVNPVNPPPLEFSPESNYSRYFSSLLLWPISLV